MITGTKYLDATGDGFSADDAPYTDGATIEVFQDNGDGVFDAADGGPIETLVTDANGEYATTDLEDGRYFIQESVPDGFIQTGGPSYYTVDVVNGMVIDNFDGPAVPDEWIIALLDPDPALIKTADASILGGERDMLIDVIGSPGVVSANGSVGDGKLVFQTGSNTAPTQVNLQYDGVDADVSTPPASLVNSKGLATDLTGGGLYDGMRFDFDYIQSTDGLPYQIELTNPDGSTATYAGTFPSSDDGGVIYDPGEFFVPYNLFTNAATFDFTNVDSINISLNDPAVLNADFILDGITSAAFIQIPGKDFANLEVVPGVEIQKKTNGDDADTETGPMIPVGPTDNVLWTYEVTNTGNVALDLELVDDKEGAITTPPLDVLPAGAPDGVIDGDTNANGQFDPGETWTYSATGTATAGQYENLATVTGTAIDDQGDPLPGVDPVISTDPSHYFGTEPSLTILKTADVASVNAAGDVINYTIEVDNTGNIALTNVVLTDVLPDGTAGTVTGPTGDTDGDSALDVDETWSYTISYTATQADIDAGVALDNVATVDTEETDPLDDNALVTVVQTPALTIVKTADVASVDAAGDVISYTIDVDNTGNMTLTNVVLTDALPDGTAGTVTGPTGDTDGDSALDVDEIWSYTVSYTATQADIDAGDVLVNVATVDTDQTDPLDDDAPVTVIQTPALTIVKTADVASVDAAGDVISYTIAVDNTGNQTLTNVVLTDALPDGTAGTVTGPTGDTDGDSALDVDETWSYTISYTATQADIDAGVALDNVATVDTEETDPLDDNALVTVIQNPALTIVKTADVASVDAAGDVISYTIEVDNTGNQTLTNVVLTDELPDGTAGTVTGPTGDTDGDSALDVGETWSYTVSYIATQADIDAGDVLVNVATVDTDQTDPLDDDAPVTVEQNPALSIVKTADVASVDAADDVISYTIDVENIGNQTLTNVVLTDALPDGTAGTVTGPTGDTDGDSALDVGETWSYTASYTATQADIDAGDVLVNVATVDTDQTDPLDDDAPVTIVQNPALTITKSADVASVDEAGDPIGYTIDVENTGNQTLTNVVLTDLLPDGTAGTVAGPTGDTDGDSALDVDETWSYTISYTATQADIDAGDTLVNVATVDTDQTDPLDDDAPVTIEQNPALTIVKTADVLTVDDASDVINYTIDVENTGNQTLTNVVLTDVLPDGTAGTIAGPTGDTDGDSELDVGEIWTYTTSYAVSQADIDAGGTLINVATVDTDQTDPLDDDAPVSVGQNPELTIVKTADVASVDEAGDVINYTIDIENTGLMTLTNVVLTDVLPDGTAGTVVGPTGDDGDSAFSVGEMWSYTISYTATQADIDAGDTLVNVATVDTDQTEPADDDAPVSVVQNPALTIVKTADVASVDAAGDVISYTIDVDNTGNMTLTNVVLTDALPDGTDGTVAGPTGDTDGDSELDLGETWSYTVSYIATQADIDAGVALVNVATVDTDQTDPLDDDAPVTIEQNPAITIVKTADVASVDAAGDVIGYTIDVENTGNVTLTNVVLTDALPDGTAGTVAGPTGDTDGDSELDVDETWSYTISYTATQADIDAGDTLVNVATVDTDQTAPLDDDAPVTVIQNPAISIVKTADVASVDAADDLINYTIDVENTGNVTLTNVVLTDALPDGTAGTVAGPTGDTDGDSELDVDETWSYTVSYTATQADIDAGDTLVNVATVDTDQTAPLDDDAPVTVIQNPAITIVKTADVVLVDGADDVINYTIDVENTGNVTLTNVVLTDALPDGTAGTVAGPTGDTDGDSELDVDETWSYTVSYTATQADIDAGALLVNVATVDTDQTDPLDDDAVATVRQNPAITIDKTADVESVEMPDDIIVYTIVIENTGNMTLTNVVLSDLLPDGTAGTVAGPTGDTDGDSELDVDETWSYTVSYTVSEADIDAGVDLVNVATVATDQTYPIDDDAVVVVLLEPEIDIEKYTNSINADLESGPVVHVGDMVTFDYIVSNPRVATIKNVVVIDDAGTPLDTSDDFSPTFVKGDDNANGMLDDLETWVYQATRVATAGQYGNNAVVTGENLSGSISVTDEDPSHHFGLVSEIDIQKHTNNVDADDPSGVHVLPNGMVTWDYYVTNPDVLGSLPLDNVAVSDSDASVAPVYGSGDNGNGLLDPGEQWHYRAIGAAQMGQYANLGTVTATDWLGAELTDADPSHYFGIVPGIGLNKITAGVDTVAPTGPYLHVTDVATFTYVVFNTGNTTLGNVSLSDDAGTPGEVADDFSPVYISGDSNDDGLLQVDEVWFYSATEPVAPGQYENVADVSAVAVYDDGVVVPGIYPVYDIDLGHYFGANPQIDVEKTTNDEQADLGPGPIVFEGDQVLWNYVVTNPGNVALGDVILTDTQGVVPIYQSGDVNDDGLLDISETWLYSAVGTVTVGEYENRADVIGTPVDDTGDVIDGFSPVTDFDLSHYDGYELSTISGYVYADVNDNGVMEFAEQPLAGVVVTLTGTDYLGNEVSVPATMTNLSGYYEFIDLLPGNYTVVESQPVDFIDGKDTIGTAGGVTTNDQFSEIILQPGEHSFVNNFGEWGLLPGVISKDPYLVPFGETLTINGTDGDDQLEVKVRSATQAWEISLNGIEFQIVSPLITNLELKGFEGTDTLDLVGTDLDDVLVMGPDFGVLTSGPFEVAFESFEDVDVLGGAGYDTASLNDSPGDDLLRTTPETALLTGDGFSLGTDGFEKVHAYAKAGGADTAFMHGSAGADKFKGYPLYGMMRGGDYYRRAKFFEEVYADASQGGNDKALFFDSDGNDTLIGQRNLTSLTTDTGLVRSAASFDTVVAYSKNGGFDQAELNDTTGNDIFRGLTHKSEIYGKDYHITVRAFDKVIANASTGFDKAKLYDSAGDDIFIGRPDESKITGNNLDITASGFDKVNVFSRTGGVDLAKLYDTAGNDSVVADGDRVRLLTEDGEMDLLYETLAFARVHVYGSTGSDTSHVDVDSIELDLIGEWTEK